MSGTTRPRRAGRDEGQALVLVLVICAALVVLLTAGVATAIAALGQSSEYTSTDQAQLAAQTGISVELASMRSTATWAALSCGASGTTTVSGTTSSYSVTVVYYGAGSALTCSGATLGGLTAPSSARLTSHGKARGGTPATVVADVSISVTPSITPFPGYAIFTEGAADFTNVTVLNSSAAGLPDVYVGGLATCNNTITSAGTLITYDSTDVLDLHNKCTFTSIVAAGAVALSNGSNASGSITSYGTSTSTGCTGTMGVCVDGVTVGGNVTAIGTSAGIGVGNNGTIDGNADAEGSISVTSGSIKGAQISGDGTLAARHIDTDYPPLTFPVYDPGVTAWQAAGWNVDQVDQSDCAAYFKDQSGDDFMLAIQNATQKTVIYAPDCPVKYTSQYAFELGSDIALQVQSLTLTNADTFDPTVKGTSGSPKSVNFAVLAGADQSCSTSTLTVTVPNQTEFAPIPVSDPYSTVNVLLYTPGSMDFSNKNTFDGQILACDGFTGTGNLTLTYSPAAGLELPGIGGSTAPTVTVDDKYSS